MTINTGESHERQRVALFASDANFSRQVLHHLLQSGINPDLIVLPEYPPARIPAKRADLLTPEDGDNRLLRMVPRVEIEYLPRSQQLELVPKLAARKIDFGLIACWPYLMRTELIGVASRAMLNLHPSLLPSYRGADPVSVQIDRGESNGGVSLHLLNQQFDAGDIVAQAGFEMTVAERERHWIEMKCAVLGVRLFLEAMKTYPFGWQLHPQSDF